MLSEDVIQEALDAYPKHAVFARVEDDRLETLPDAFRDGTHLWKDVEWVVRWYCRRPLDAHDRASEEAFRENGMDAVNAAIEQARTAADIPERIAALTTLRGVDVPIASAFLQFIDPESYAAIDERVWAALREAGAIDQPYPSSVQIEMYDTFLRECHGLAASTDLRVVDVARALWVLGANDHPTP